MRKNHIDNLRWLSVVVLFVYHTFVIYNTFGENFYVEGAKIQVTTGFITVLSPWYMPLMFMLAGISTTYSLQKRTVKQYLRERVSKLLIPLIFGILLLVPVQAYFAAVFHNGYTGSYLAYYPLFFTKVTDLSSYDGNFGVAHLWFILYLFIISLVTLPLIKAYQKSGKKINMEKISTPVLLLFALVPVVTQLIVNIGGKSLGEFLTWYLFGAFLISDDSIQEKLRKNCFWFLGVTVLCIIVVAGFQARLMELNIIILSILYMFFAWITMLGILGLSSRYFEFRNPVTAYLTKASFGLYIIHQQWTVVVGFFVLSWVSSVPLQMLAIIIGCTAFTFLTYEILRRFSLTRFMFGLKR